MRGQRKLVKILFFSVLKNIGPLTLYICSFSSSSLYTQFQDKSCFCIAVQTSKSVFEYKVLRLLVTPFVVWFNPVFSPKFFQCLDDRGIRAIKLLLTTSSLKKHGRQKKFQFSLPSIILSWYLFLPNQPG